MPWSPAQMERSGIAVLHYDSDVPSGIYLASIEGVAYAKNHRGIHVYFKVIGTGKKYRLWTGRFQDGAASKFYEFFRDAFKDLPDDFIGDLARIRIEVRERILSDETSKPEMVRLDMAGRAPSCIGPLTVQ